MRMKLGIVLAAALAVVWAGAASAQIGCSLGAGIGGSFANTVVSSGAFGVDGVGSTSTRPDVGLRGECGVHIGSGPVYVGALAGYDWENVQFAVNPSLFHASLGDSYYFGGRVGVMTGPVMPYALLAYRHADANWSVSSPLLPTSFHGLEVGGGLEWAPFAQAKQITLAGEVDWTHFAEERIGTSSTTLQPDQLQAMLRVNWRFGFGGDTKSAAAPLK